MNSSFKQVRQIINAHEAREGTSAKIGRVIGNSEVRTLDPFIMLDYFVTTKPGFTAIPPHPHRGFIAVTYIIEGTLWHEDFKGGYGVLNTGDVQWMSAGQGIVHTEMLRSHPGEGVQLWVNLKASDKMSQPSYQEIKDESMPKIVSEGVRVKILTGSALGVTSQINTQTPVTYLDVELEDRAEFEHEFDAGSNSFIFVFRGTVRIGQEKIKSQKGAILSNEPRKAKFVGDGRARFLVLSGQPLRENISNYGPFVMNTQAEIERAINDYRRGTNGFEGALTWEPRHITY